MSEENTNDSKKGYKWIGAILIVLLLIFIGIAGFYLEHDFGRVNKNSVEQSEIIQQGDQETENQSEQSGADSGESILNDNSAVQSQSDLNLNKNSANDVIKTDTSTNEIESENSKDITSAAKDVKKEKLAEIIEQNEAGSLESEILNPEKVKLKEDLQNKDYEIQHSSNQSDQETDNQSEKSVNNSDLVENNKTEVKQSLFDRLMSIIGLNEAEFEQNLNILFVGFDDEASVSLGTVEADSIMLAYLRPNEHKIFLKNIDQDLIYQKRALKDYPESELKEVVRNNFESELNNYVYVNYQGFEKVIDELGGIELKLAEPLKISALGLNLKAGSNMLSGKEALNFTRWKGGSKSDRLARQKKVINAVLAKLRSNSVLFNVKDLYNTIVNSYNSVETDIDPVLAAEIFNYIHKNSDLKLEYIE
ncbi:LCP family protein [Halanaerobium salsuginis]|uniref:Transcriptional attenuator, LytR family n=1 Tax=Halanaerobium salsuginis TaxID=29563 RepID=A0A1I4EQ05_9FIRM|nr:LCP family protein [Halanaerobium salsuginis]SFL07293.1 transcriptional attenuator, LytR family [Halanaerobium salsuginis]